ncbi:MAG: Ppx/GppA family phosphatase [Armatimonadetes bacterium]|nr:Ppx/GppA family phosphatase [Armatimonadota bacterium]
MATRTTFGDHAPRYAAVDIGSNTVKLTIVARASDGDLTPVLDAGVTTRLGEGIEQRRLGEEPMRRTLEALGRCMSVCEEHGVEEIRAVGTSALRDARNSRDFVEKARAIGLAVDVISGAEEAHLSAQAVRADPMWRHVERLAVVDIGGGSTEIILDTVGASAQRKDVSLQLGAVRLTEAALHSDPPTPTEIEQAVAHADAALSAIRDQSGERGVSGVVGVGGTVTNMGAVRSAVAGGATDERLHGLVLKRAEIERQIAMYAGVPTQLRKTIAGLDPARADVILAGAIILSRVLAALGRDEVAVSCRGLRWGVLYESFAS